jgi:Spy/CpxP family protein refolding chaperone
MKTTLCAIALALSAPAFTVFAEEKAAPAPAPSPGQGWHWRMPRMFHAWKSLTPEEQQKVKTARKAVKNNPDVVAARTKLKAEAKSFHETQKAAMLKSDPSLAPILEKLDKAQQDEMKSRPE